MIPSFPQWTHYAYLSGPDGIREPERLYNLTVYGTDKRRALIHDLMRQGRLLSVLPWGFQIKSLSDLRQALIWLRDDKPPNSP